MPLVELLPVTYDPARQLMWTDENFRRISDAIEKLGSPASGGGGSGLSVPAGNVVAGTFGSNVGGGAYTFLNSQVVFNSSSVDNVVIKGAGGDLRIEDRDLGGDFFALYVWNDHFRLWSSAVSADRHVFENTGRAIIGGTGHTGAAIMGPWPADGNYAFFGSYQKAVGSASHYGMLVSGVGGDQNVYFGGTDIYFRKANNGSTTAQFRGDFIKEFYGDSGNWDIGSGVRARIWNDGEFWAQSVGLGGDNGYNKGLTISNDGWIRHYTADIGWHNEARGAGMMGASTFGNQTCTTNNNETTIIARKISQGGWATAGLSSFGESSSMVPYISLHASGCCTTNWRKDSGASYVVDVNSGGGCDWVYAANHPVCSERARKHNISVAEEYGLKTVRGLKPHKFQYTPTSEDEIFAWEKWKYDRSIGIWTHPPSEHMGWDDWHVGYFAEEMINLVPEVVGLHPDGTPKGIDYGNLVVVAIAAINELADRLEDLEARSYAA